MNAPPIHHRVEPDRWDGSRLAVFEQELRGLAEALPFVVSGGWAWHLMTPVGHAEYLQAHDHRDLDLFLDPQSRDEAGEKLRRLGYIQAWTRFDSSALASAGGGSPRPFARYVKDALRDDRYHKVTIDLFLEPIASREIQAPWGGSIRVVPPIRLLELYHGTHQAESCLSVRIARDLLVRGVDPVGHPEMAEFASWLDSARFPARPVLESA